MRKKTALSEKEFLRLSLKDQAKELKKMTKRANVRLSLLEEKDTITLAYRQAYQYNLGLDRESNRFYEGTKYKDAKDIKDAFRAVSGFLKNKSSTMQGIDENIKDVIGAMTKSNQIDENIIKKMSAQEQRYASKYIAQASNKKIKELDKEGIHQYAYGLAETYNKAEGRKNNSFYRGTKFDNETELQKHLENMINFYNAKTSTPQGYKESIKSRLDKFRTKGVYIPYDKEYEFFQFLASNEFKKMGARADSNQVFEIFAEARNEGKEVDEINQAFKDFLDTNMTIDQVEERLGTSRFKFRKDVIQL